MNNLVAAGAESDQVLLGVISESASWLNVVNLEPGRTPAVLAAPGVSLQHLLAKSTVGIRVEAEPAPPWVQASHEAFLSCSRNCFCCGGGRN